MKLESSIVVMKPAGKVWSLMTDPVYFSRWQDGYESTVIISGEPGTPGYKARHVFMENKKKTMIDEEVLEIVPNEKMVVRKEHPAMTRDIVIQLKPLKEGTEINMKSKLNMKAFSFRVLSPFLKGPFQKHQQEELKRLKTFIESASDDSWIKSV